MGPGTGRQHYQGGASDRPTMSRSMDPLSVWGPGLWTPQTLWDLPPVQATFNGVPEKVALFLSQVISHVDLYGHLYPSQ